jgi:hypothetical protein
VDIVRANQNYMSLAKHNKIKTVIYTINDKKQLSKTLEFNPEMILSDHPELFLGAD